MGAAATAGGIVEFRDPSSGDGEFPATISCSGPQNALVCSGGDAPQGAQAFTLLKVAEAAVAIQFVGGGVDDGSGVQSAPLVCSHPGDRLICSTAPPGESKSFAVYAPAA